MFLSESTKIMKCFSRKSFLDSLSMCKKLEFMFSSSFYVISHSIHHQSITFTFIFFHVPFTFSD